MDKPSSTSGETHTRPAGVSHPMDKIVLFENTSMQQLVMESMLKVNDDLCIVPVNKLLLGVTGITKTIQDAFLIMMDVDHGGGGVESFLEEIRHGKANSRLPVILLASSPKKELVGVAAKYGDVDILAKPFTAVELLEKVLKHRKAPVWENRDAMDMSMIQPLDGEAPMERVMLKWSDAFSIGIEEIDAEHKEIVDHFEKLYMLMREGHGHEYYLELLAFLQKYVNTHFAHEEKLQNALGYDQLEEHRVHHEQFRKQVEAIARENAEKKATHMDLIKLNLFIKEWLIHHILVEDKRIGRSIREKADRNAP